VRAVAIGCLVAAVAVVGALLLRDGSTYRVVAVTQDAGQLVKGNLVKVGGISIGEVEEIELGAANEARIVLRIDEERFTPLHRGTKATIRSPSLSSVAGRVVALHPGPNDAAEIDDGGEIPSEDTQPIVDLDQVINTLDVETRSALQEVVHGGADAFGGRGRARATRAALEALSPALQETTATANELVRDQRAFARALITSAGVVEAVAGERASLERGLANGATTLGAIAREAGSLDESLRRAPQVLRASNSTLADLRTVLDELRPALREARPVARRLAPVLRDTAPVVGGAGPVVADVRALLGDATPVLSRLPRTERSAVPALRSARTALEKANPVIAALRAYTPDVVAGLFNGFGGTTGGYYDANGHYVRISVQGNAVTAQGAGSALNPPSTNAAGAYFFRRGVLSRCPGAATQAHPDGSNPWKPDEAPCKREDDAP
jgi:phospholipid/cholesterol/gamma-HCH transport system substrate-binding protein